MSIKIVIILIIIKTAKLSIFYLNNYFILRSAEKEQILKTFEAFLDKAPKHAYAAILMALGIKGKEFADSLRLGHDAANTVRKQVESLAPDSVDSINQLNFEQLKVRNSKNDRYYIGKR